MNSFLNYAIAIIVIAFFPIIGMCTQTPPPGVIYDTQLDIMHADITASLVGCNAPLKDAAASTFSIVDMQHNGQ